MSSFDTEEGFGYFLRRSLAMMRVETPWLHERMCAEVAGREIAVEVDGERLVLEFHETGFRLLDNARRAAVEVGLSRAVILRLVDGETTLLESILAGDVVVFARVADLVALHDGLMTYLAGLVRCPSAEGLLESFRKSRSWSRR